MNRDEYLGAGFFVHPLPLLAVGLLALNDHYLKLKFANEITGKLSDFCGLFFFPLFLCAIALLLARIFCGKKLWLSWPALGLAVAVTDGAFTAIKIDPTAAVFAENILGGLGFISKIVSDPTDLLALAVNIPLYYYARAAIGDGHKSNI